MEREYLKAGEAAAMLGVCRGTVLNLVKQGKLPVACGLRSKLIRRSDIEKLFVAKSHAVKINKEGGDCQV